MSVNEEPNAIQTEANRRFPLSPSHRDAFIRGAQWTQTNMVYSSPDIVEHLPLFKREPREGSYFFVTAPAFPGWSYMLSPVEREDRMKLSFISFLEAEAERGGSTAVCTCKNSSFGMDVERCPVHGNSYAD